MNVLLGIGGRRGGCLHAGVVEAGFDVQILFSVPRTGSRPESRHRLDHAGWPAGALSADQVSSSILRGQLPLSRRSRIGSACHRRR
jgi:hypothetical protein